jgi:hypothetical protein
MDIGEIRFYKLCLVGGMSCTVAEISFMATNKCCVLLAFMPGLIHESHM